MVAGHRSGKIQQNFLSQVWFLIKSVHTPTLSYTIIISYTNCLIRKVTNQAVILLINEFINSSSEVILNVRDINVLSISVTDADIQNKISDVSS